MSKLPVTAPETVRPMVRWAGSKRRALKAMWPHLPPSFDRYVEPFCGSACVFYKLDPQAALLNDLNSDLISFYLMARNNTKRVYEAFPGIRRSKASYYRVRSDFKN